MFIQPKKIDIQSHIVEMFIGKFGDISVQKFCNDMLEKLLTGYILEVDGVQRDKITAAAKALHLTPDEILNQILIRIDLDIKIEEEKIKVPLAKQSHKLNVRKINKVVNY